MYIKTLEVAGIYPAFKGMRNPRNSHHLSDSLFSKSFNIIGDKDMKLAQNLIKAGGEHRKFLRQIRVWADFNMPRYWWSEMDTYHFNTKNSESTIYKLLNNKNPITVNNFVHNEDEDTSVLDSVIVELNDMREFYLSSKDKDVKNNTLIRAKRMLPESWLQLRTVDHSYEEIRNIYHQRKNHPLKEEWGEVFTEWVESLPYAKELLIYDGKENK